MFLMVATTSAYSWYASTCYLLYTPWKSKDNQTKPGIRDTWKTIVSPSCVDLPPLKAGRDQFSARKSRTTTKPWVATICLSGNRFGPRGFFDEFAHEISWKSQENLENQSLMLYLVNQSKMSGIFCQCVMNKIIQMLPDFGRPFFELPGFEMCFCFAWKSPFPELSLLGRRIRWDEIDECCFFCSIYGT